MSSTYSNTDIRGDGQVVTIHFDSYAVEVVPAFLLTDQRYLICDTHNGGRYKLTQPWAELQQIQIVDDGCNGNLRPLIRMLKTWQSYCSVPIKSFQLELLATEFVFQSPWRGHFWYDWRIRDFFAYLCARANTDIIIPGTNEYLPLGNAWLSRSEMAYNRAVKACDYEKNNLTLLAGEEWQKIFGYQIPRIIL